MDIALQLLLALTTQIGPISALILKMQAEGRTTMTPEEWAPINAAYEAAHVDALAALAEAKAQGR